MQYKTVSVFGDSYDVEYGYEMGKPVMQKIVLSQDRSNTDLTDLLREKVILEIKDKFEMAFAWRDAA